MHITKETPLGTTVRFIGANNHIITGIIGTICWIRPKTPGLGHFVIVDLRTSAPVVCEDRTEDNKRWSVFSDWEIVGQSEKES